MAGGKVMYPILLCSIVALAMFMERMWMLRSARVLPRALSRTLNTLLAEQKYDEALDLATSSGVALGRVYAIAIEHRGRPRDQIKERLEEVGRREAAELEWGIPVVGTIASIAPLLGLLGTVGGMITTFAAIQTSGLGNVGNLAGGISQALITTFAGLTVGIPAVVANRFLLSRVDTLLLELEEVSLKLLDSLAGDEA